MPSKLHAPLGRFHIRGELGRGGMGVVYTAEDPELEREVAIKVILDPVLADPELVRRFEREVRITAQLEHPGVVPVYEVGTDDAGRRFFVMQRLRGETLEHVLEQLAAGEEETLAAWPLSRRLGVLLQICHTVAYAHSRSVLHRDIKPANIMLGEFGEVLLLDWGIARFLTNPDETLTSGRPIITASPEALTEYGSMIGTPGYMAPEQAVGAPPDVRSDVWSLGAVLYQLLTFEKTFGGPTLEAMMALMQGPPQDPRKRAPELDIGDDIAEICLAALDPDLGPRTPSAMALHDAIDDVVQGRARAAAAARTVEAARAVWEEHRQQRRERRTLLSREAQLEGSIPAWAPLAQKADLLWVRRRLRALEVESSDTVEQVVSLTENALNQDPTCEAASDLLALVHYARFEEAEEAGDVPAQRWSAGRVRKYDLDGSWTRKLRGVGHLTLRTHPPGAEVICERFDRDEIVALRGDRRVLGRTPLEGVAIEPGSYLLTLRSPGLRPTRYPIFLPRGHTWHSGPVPVPLYSDAEIGDAFVYIPGGPARIGGLVAGPEEQLPRGNDVIPGFFASVLPVTVSQYNDFLNSMGPQEAWRHTPRRTPSGEGGRYWARPAPGEPFVIPTTDEEGDRWDPQFPVFGVSWWDAKKYAARAGAELPLDRQFEKMSRGVDGRAYPWGDGFDASLCCHRDSRDGRPHPAPVGTYAGDISVYGVRDVAGSMRTWCREPSYDGDSELRTVRGGFWNCAPMQCRATCRGGDEPQQAFTLTGFRLVRDRPLPV